MMLQSGWARIWDAVDRRPDALRFYDHIRRGRFVPGLRLTCRGKDDGGGAQVHAVISAMALANAASIGYVHAPFRSIAHSDGQPRWEERWENFFNLGDGETPLDEGRDRVVPLDQFLADRRLWREPGVIVERNHYHAFTDRRPGAYRPLLPALRRKYALTPKPAPVAPPGIAIAIHLRRGDVGPAMADRYTGDEPLLRTLEAIRAEIPTAAFALYSEGEPHSFQRFAEAGCALHLGGDVFGTIDALVGADVLVMAKSSFSYVPALYGGGVKLYEPFWHAPLPEWIVRDAAGGFDRARFAAALEASRR